MKIKYKGNTYKISIKDGMIIEWKMILLLLKRIKRLGVRILEVTKKELIVLLLAISIYVSIVCFIECKYMNKNLLSCLWETKAEVFTVFVVVSVTEIYRNERKWKTTIRKWHSIYADYMHIYENDIKKLIGCLEIKTERHIMIIYTRELYKSFLEDVRKNYTNHSIVGRNRRNAIRIINNIIKTTLELKDEVYNNEFLKNKDTFSFLHRSLINNAQLITEKLEENETNLEKELTNILREIYCIISYIRNLWRTEIDIDREIIYILKSNNENCINNDYYLSALAYKDK